MQTDTSSDSVDNVVQTPLLGFGTYNKFIDHHKVYDAVKDAINCGYRHIDLAKMYENEVEVGTAIRECIAEGVVSRKDLYVCNKLFMSDCAPEDVEPAIRASLRATGLNYFDNYLMHWPVQWNKDAHRIEGTNNYNFTIIHQGDLGALARTYTAMELLVDAGLTRSIGVSNFSVGMLQHILNNCRIPPHVHQFELHPYLQQPNLVDYCQEHDIHIVAYSSLGHGSSSALLEDPVICAIAESTGRTPAQVLLRWAVQQGYSVLPKSTTPARIRSNALVRNWALSRSQMARIAALDRGERFVTCPWFDFEEAPTPDGDDGAEVRPDESDDDDTGVIM